MAASRRPRAVMPVARPRLPPARDILPYLRKIDLAAWYSNHGPLSRTLQGRLAEYWGLPEGAVTLLSNATAALTLTLIASGARPGSRCLMPSWSFIASAGAVHAAGLVPHFVDVRADTWAPDPAEVLALAGQHDVGAVLVVSPFGAPLDMAAWDAVRDATGLPVVIDAAAAFDTLRAGGPMALGSCPAVVSLHATKVFGVGEGGALLTRDIELLDRVRRLAQFGFLGTRQATVPGVNAKLSEYAAAVGLAGLDGWTDTRTRWAITTGAYVPRLRLLPGVATLPGFGRGFVSSTATILWPGHLPDPASALAERGIATLRWWGDGCHAHPAYAHCPAEPLPVTETLAARAVGLPFWQDLTPMQVDVVCTALLDAADLATARLPAMHAA